MKNQKQFDRLLTIMSTQSVSYHTERMKATILNDLNKQNLGYTFDNYGNIYVEKGNASVYPTMVCHIDTVHDIKNNVQVIHIDDSLLAIDKDTSTQYGIGGDDKVGIFITLELLRTFENFKAVFFLDEEVGCVGSSLANFSFFDNSSFVLQCDRQRIEDFVTKISSTKLSSKKLQKQIKPILKKYNRNCTDGGMTDVLEIAKNNDVQVANVSCGYYNPHTNREYIKISEVMNTLDFCQEILHFTSDKRYSMDTKSRTVAYTYSDYSWGYTGYGSYKPFNTRSTYYSKTGNSKNSRHKRKWNSGQQTQFNQNETVDHSQSSSKYDHDHLLQTECPKCGSYATWWDSYQSQNYCMDCQSYHPKISNKLSFNE